MKQSKILGKDDFAQPEFIPRLCPAERNYYIIGNGKIRAMIKADDNTGSGLQIGLHDLSLQCAGRVFGTEYELLDMQWTRILVKIEDRIFWVPASAVAYHQESQFKIGYKIIGRHIFAKSLLYPIDGKPYSDKIKLYLDLICDPKSPTAVIKASVQSKTAKQCKIELLLTIAPRLELSDAKMKANGNKCIHLSAKSTSLSIFAKKGNFAHLEISQYKDFEGIPKFHTISAEDRNSESVILEACFSVIGKINKTFSVIQKLSLQSEKALERQTVDFHCQRQDINEAVKHATSLPRALSLKDGQLYAAESDGYN